MMAKSHIVVGAASWVLFSSLTDAPLTVALVLVSAISSLLPDMDHPSSTFGRLIKPLSVFISGVFGHRGITHSIFAIALLVWLITKYGYFAGHVVSAIAIGYLSHLIADFMTPHGVPLLYPIKAKFKSPITVKSGGFGESIIVSLVFTVLVMHIFFPDVGMHKSLSTIVATFIDFKSTIISVLNGINIA